MAEWTTEDWLDYVVADEKQAHEKKWEQLRFVYTNTADVPANVKDMALGLQLDIMQGHRCTCSCKFTPVTSMLYKCGAGSLHYCSDYACQLLKTADYCPLSGHRQVVYLDDPTERMRMKASAERRQRTSQSPTAVVTKMTDTLADMLTRMKISEEACARIRQRAMKCFVLCYPNTANAAQYISRFVPVFLYLLTIGLTTHGGDIFIAVEPELVPYSQHLREGTKSHKNIARVQALIDGVRPRCDSI